MLININFIKTTFLIFVFAGCFYFTFEALFNLIFTEKYWNISEKLNKPRGALFTAAPFHAFFLGVLTVIPLWIVFQFMRSWYFMPVFVVIGGIHITLNEFLMGLLFNKVFKLKLWDYSNWKFHILGQTSLIHYGLWTALSGGIYLIFHTF